MTYDTHSSAGAPEFVLTAPEPYAALLAHRVRGRMTLGALTQLVAGARSSIIISAPFLQAGQGLDAGPLAAAFTSAIRRGVDVQVLSTAAGLRTLDTQGLKTLAGGKLRLFQPSSNAEDERQLGSHAKFCVVDGEHAYIGSANLTGPGLSRNVEMGVLVHGHIAQKVYEFWDLAVEYGLICEVPT